jgi:XTP/dITP diphosphohydrolase
VKHSLVVATTNRGKLAELRALLAGLPVRVLAPDEACAHPPRVVEDGATFADNAGKKARAVAAASKMLTLADDSGLEVDALGGAPGVRSARYAHERATDAENNAALLAALEALGDRAHDPAVSRARFRCVLALVDPFTDDGAPILTEGACEGTITRTPRGAGGFGYDPLFVVEGDTRTLAELTEGEKLERVLARRAQVVANVVRDASRK